jgi:hypothetical protein
MSAADALGSLARELRAERSVISPHVRDPDASGAGPAATLGELAAAGPRAAARSPLYAGVVESVREGYLLHYGAPRLVDPPDPDLALLAGDYLYAKGLGLLASIGDLDSVRALADLIAASAELHADGGEAGSGDRLAALWLATAISIAVGPSPADRQAVERLRAGGSAEGLYAHASAVATRAGLGERLTAAAETVGFAPLHRG